MIATQSLKLPHARLPAAAEAERAKVRAFIKAERSAGRLPAPVEIGMRSSPETSRKLAANGWIGMTWPKAYGGHEKSALARYVVTEELLAAAVPVGSHWVADRQSGPVILRYGTEEQKRKYLPTIAAGECYFCIGMSEPNSGSDLASLRTRGDKVSGGWRLNGQKIWTSRAHLAHNMITLVRTSKEEDRHGGFSQLIVDLSSPGITVRPIINMVGQHDFNEVFLDDVFVPDACLIGDIGAGWSQVSAELAFERSGPERWLSAFSLLNTLITELGDNASNAARGEIGRLASHVLALRQLSISVAAALERGEMPNVQAAIVKDMGTRFEQGMVRSIRDIMIAERPLGASDGFEALLTHAELWAPAFTIRGGTAEIMRGIIARGLGVR